MIRPDYATFVLRMLNLIWYFVLMPSGVYSQGAKNSLNWTGIYRGIIPCADCEGIETTVILNPDKTFLIKSIYVGRSVSPRIDKGKFTWSPDGNEIILKDSTGHVYSKFTVKKNALIQLSLNGRPIVSPLASNYMLTKGYYAIQEKYWKLIRLYGKAVFTDSTFHKEPHLMLSGGESRFSGNGGCNNIGGQYKLINPDSIAFSKAISTMMACPDLQQESSFLGALNKTRTYKVSGDKLVFMDREKNVIAEFKSMNTH